MSFIAEYQKGDTVYFNGKTYTVSETYNDNYLSITDENGKSISVSTAQLSKTSLFSLKETYKETIEERNKKIEDYQQKAEDAKKEKNNWLDKIKELRTLLRNIEKSEPMYTTYKDQLSNAKSQKTSSSNREYGYLIDAFLVASDPIYA